MFRSRTTPSRSPLGHLIDARLTQLGGKSAGKTQSWLAEQVGVSTNAVSKWMRSSQISREHAVALARALRVAVDQVLSPPHGPGGQLVAHEPTVPYHRAVPELATPMRARTEGLDQLCEIATQLSQENRRRLFRHAVELLRQQPPTPATSPANDRAD